MKNRLKEPVPAVNIPPERINPLLLGTPLTSKPASSDISNTQRRASEITRTPLLNATDAIYRMPKVSDLTGLSRSSIYRLEALGLFPNRIKLSASASGWRSAEIHAWIADRPLAAVARGAK